MSEYVCGFCGGDAIPDEEDMGYMHAEPGDRVRVGVSGDYVSARHNRAGTAVLACDLVSRKEWDADTDDMRAEQAVRY